MQRTPTETLNPPFGNFFFLSLKAMLCVMVALTHVETAFNLDLTIIVWIFSKH